MKILVLALAIFSSSCMYIIHDMNSKHETELAVTIEESKAQEKMKEEKIRDAEEISRLKESLHEAVTARVKAENEAEALRAEKESEADTAKRYKNQLDALRKENEKLKSEVDRLTKKLNNSLVRIANPFKH